MTHFRHGFLFLLAVTVVIVWTRSTFGLMKIRTDEGLYNVALNNPIYVQNVLDEEASLLVDGKRSTCIAKNKGPDNTWQVNLKDGYTIFDMRVIPTEEYFEEKTEGEEICYRKLKNYEGTVNKTKSGRTCQRWDKQSPHRHQFKPENYWYRGSDFLLNNYCRVPNNLLIPWCITTDPNVLYEQCNVLIAECVNVIENKMHIKIGNYLIEIPEVSSNQIDEYPESTSFWTYLLPDETKQQYAEFYQNGTDGTFDLCEIEIYGTKENISNVALNKPSTASGRNQHSSSEVVDGKIQLDRTCVEMGNDEQPWWQVDLEDIFIIYILRIYKFESSECPYNPCKNGGKCTLRHSNDTSKEPDFLCKCTESSSGELCEDCSQNVALKKEVLASSILHSAWPTSNVNDGDIGQFVDEGATCVATRNEMNPFIIIDLGEEYTISAVKIYKQLDLPSEYDQVAIQLFLMEKTWKNYGTFEESKKTLKHYIVTRLVRLQKTMEYPVSLRVCEVEVFAICQEGKEERVKQVMSTPYMQMRFTLSNKYNDVVQEEEAFIYTIKQELSIVTNYSQASFKNMKVQKDPFRVEFELHSTEGNLKKLSKMLETIDILCGQGMDMMTEDGNKLSIVAGSLQYHLMYTGSAGTLYSPIYVAVCVFVYAVLYL